MKGKHVPKESSKRIAIAGTPRGRSRRKAQEDVSLMSRSVPTTFYSNLAPPRAPLLSSRRAPNESPSSFMLPPSPDFSGEIMEKFVGGRSLTYSNASNFPSSVPASFLSNRMQHLNTNRSETNKTQYISRKPVGNMGDGDDNNSPSSSHHSGRAEENEPPIVGSFTCFQLMDLEKTEKTTSTNTNYQNSILFNLDDDPNTEQPEDDGDLDDGLQFDFD